MARGLMKLLDFLTFAKPRKIPFLRTAHRELVFSRRAKAGSPSLQILAIELECINVASGYHGRD
jgi:hypothetical protein